MPPTARRCVCARCRRCLPEQASFDLGICLLRFTPATDGQAAPKAVCARIMLFSVSPTKIRLCASPSSSVSPGLGCECVHERSCAGGCSLKKHSLVSPGSGRLVTGRRGYVQEAGELLCLVKRDLPGTTSLEEEEQRSSEKLPSRPEGCVQVSSYHHASGT